MIELIDYIILTFSTENNLFFHLKITVQVPGVEPYREYLYTNLRVQPIWTSMRFWTAAFFDAVQCERAVRPVPHRPKSLDQEAVAAEDRNFQANIVFGQLGYDFLLHFIQKITTN